MQSLDMPESAPHSAADVPPLESISGSSNGKLAGQVTTPNVSLLCESNIFDFGIATPLGRHTWARNWAPKGILGGVVTDFGLQIDLWQALFGSRKKCSSDRHYGHNCYALGREHLGLKMDAKRVPQPWAAAPFECGFRPASALPKGPGQKILVNDS